MDLNQLEEKCLKHGYKISIDKFKLYIELLQEWNNKINLTAITDYNEIVEKHFFDSLLPLFDKDIKGKICDVGSGAGFPSIPMKIVDDSLEVVIVEPLAKRCKFLNELVSRLNLDNVLIVNARSEDYVKDNREIFDVVTARGVANLSVLSELCIPLVKVGGYFVALKGDKGLQEKDEASNAVSKLGCKLDHINKHIFNNMTRINIVYKKVEKTSNKYPRHFSKIKKNPL